MPRLCTHCDTLLSDKFYCITIRAVIKSRKLLSVVCCTYVLQFRALSLSASFISESELLTPRAGSMCDGDFSALMLMTVMSDEYDGSSLLHPAQ